MEAIEQHEAGPRLVAGAVRERVRASLRASVRRVLSWAMRPSARIARRLGMAAIVAARNGRQVPISAGVGLFSGGTQRTALVIMQSRSVEAVGRVGAIDALGEAVLEQRLVEQIAGIVAGEGAAGAVGAFEARRQTDDQQPRRLRSRTRVPARCASRASRWRLRCANRRAAGTSAQSRAGSHAAPDACVATRAGTLARRLVRITLRPAPCQRGGPSRPILVVVERNRVGSGERRRTFAGRGDARSTKRSARSVRGGRVEDRGRSSARDRPDR